MTRREHLQRHIELHHALDELLADYLRHNLVIGDPAKRASIHDEIYSLMKWSHAQMIEPTEDDHALR